MDGIAHRGLGPDRETFTGTEEERRVLYEIGFTNARIKQLSYVDPDRLDAAAILAAEEYLAALQTRLAEIGAVATSKEKT